MISLESMVGFYESFGYFAVFGVLLLCGFGLPLPEDISIIAGGVISGLGFTNVHIMCLVSLTGVLLGDCLIYHIGKKLGKNIFQKKIVGRFISQSLYEKITRSFKKNGIIMLFIARFLPGLRTAIFLTAGITHFVRFRTFFIIDFIAALISVPIWTYIGYFGASNRELLIHWIRDTKIGILIICGIGLIIYIIVKFVKKRIKKVEILVGLIDEDKNEKKKNSKISLKQTN